MDLNDLNNIGRQLFENGQKACNDIGNFVQKSIDDVSGMIDEAVNKPQEKTGKAIQPEPPEQPADKQKTVKPLTHKEASKRNETVRPDSKSKDEPSQKQNVKGKKPEVTLFKKETRKDKETSGFGQIKKNSNNQPDPKKNPKIHFNKKIIVAAAAVFALAAAGLGFALNKSEDISKTKAAEDALRYLEEGTYSPTELEYALNQEYDRQSAVEYALMQIDEEAWNQEAIESWRVEAAEEKYSENGLVSQLKRRGFSDSQAEFARDAESKKYDFNKCAVMVAKAHLGNSSTPNDPKTVQGVLKEREFTDSQISYVFTDGQIDWTPYCSEFLKAKLESPVSKAEAIDHLQSLGFEDECIKKVMESDSVDWKGQCKKFIDNSLNEDDLSKSILVKKCTERRFDDSHIQSLIGELNRDWKFQCIRAARHLCSEKSLSKTGLSDELHKKGFTDDETEFATRFYDESENKLPDDDRIYELIQEEQEAEEARKQAEEQERQKQEELIRQQKEEERRQQEQLEQQSAAPSEEQVWISLKGECYHSRSGCSQMKNAWQVPVSEAQAKGKRPCSRCHG